jgi:hypothetical protein
MKMKKNILYMSLSIILLTTSCDSALDLYPLDTPSAETFYTNETEIQGGVNACYAYMTDPSNDYLNYEYSWDGLTDNLYLRGTAFSTNLLSSSLDYTEGYFRSLWLRMYQGVGRCNLILQKLDENSSKISETTVNQMKGELLFLRAFYYIRLTDMFGDVVYLDKPINSTTEGASVTRSPRADVVKHIYDDLDQSATLLKGSAVRELGRATYGAAMAYKSRVALMNSDWSTAAAAAKAVIDSKEYALYPSYAKLFTEDVMLSSTNKEQILTRCHLVLANTQTSFVLHAGPRATGGWSTIVPTQNMVDSYECLDGQHIDKSPLYDKTKPYENRDPRMRASLVLPGDMWCGYVFDTRKDKTTTLNDKGETVKNMDSYSSTAYTSFTGYLLRKYFEPKYITAATKCENPFMLCRYAEVLLNYAEAKTELNQIDADCMSAINQVRTRAGMPEYPAGMSQQEMRKAIQYERKVELFTEGFRRNDLNRWKRSEVVLNRPIFGRPVLGEFSVYPSVTFDECGDPVYDDANYAPHPSTDYRVVLRTVFNKERDYLWPIPETELNLNSNLGQNPNW